MKGGDAGRGLSVALANQVIRRELSRYEVNASETLCEQIRRYCDLLLRWNAKVALTTVTDPLEILRFHFGESMFAASIVPVRVGRLADVGSGAGFPGIPLKLAAPGLDVTLIESKAKKATFLAEVIRRLGLTGIRVVRERVEDLRTPAGGFDFICSRALGQFERLTNWARVSLDPSGKLVLWLTPSAASAVSKLGVLKWDEPVPIPGSRSRCIVVGELVT